MSDWNTQTIEEFRANEGRVGGMFAEMTLALVHYKGRRSGRDYVTPLAYLADDADPSTIYVFGSKAGAPDHPDWYRNLVAAGKGTVEVGTETYDVTVEDVPEPRRSEIYAEQVGRVPQFGGYEEATAGIRTIPVVALHRA
jgi:deazaflavin-dependent oxidoreductase (nitroreductase family)